MKKPKFYKRDLEVLLGRLSEKFHDSPDWECIMAVITSEVLIMNAVVGQGSNADWRSLSMEGAGFGAMLP